MSVILSPVGWYPSMPCMSPGPPPGGRLRGLASWGGGVSRAYTQEEVEGSGWGVSRPTPMGEVEGSGVGSPSPHLGVGVGGVVSRRTPGRCVSQHALRQPPRPLVDGSFCRQYASYWNAFLLPPANEVWDKVLFSEACVILSMGGGKYLTRYTPP